MIAPDVPSVTSAHVGWLLVLGGGVLGLATRGVARLVDAVRRGPGPTRASVETLLAWRVAGFLLAAVGLALVMPALA